MATLLASMRLNYSRSGFVACHYLLACSEAQEAPHGSFRRIACLRLYSIARHFRFSHEYVDDRKKRRDSADIFPQEAFFRRIASHAVSNTRARSHRDTRGFIIDDAMQLFMMTS